MYTIHITETANADLTAIFNYIAEDSEDRASNYLGKLGQAILELQDFPNMGSRGRYEELKRLGMRMLPYDDYLILYTVSEKDEKVNIVRVVHGTVDYRRLF